MNLKLSGMGLDETACSLVELDETGRLSFKDASSATGF